VSLEGGKEETAEIGVLFLFFARKQKRGGKKEEGKSWCKIPSTLALEVRMPKGRKERQWGRARGFHPCPLKEKERKTGWSSLNFSSLSFCVFGRGEKGEGTTIQAFLIYIYLQIRREKKGKERRVTRKE